VQIDLAILRVADVALVVKDAERLNTLQRLEALEPGVGLFVYTPGEWRQESPWMLELRREAAPLE